MKKLLALNGFKNFGLIAAIKRAPEDVAAWVALIDARHKKGQLSEHADALVRSHELNVGAHAIHAFADEIAKRCSDQLQAYARNPIQNIEVTIEELVKWKTALQCGHSHDVTKGYFIDAEPFIDKQWSDIIYPLISDFDFETVLDLACGHGRNAEKLRHLSKEIHLVDINQSCIDACRERFGEIDNGIQFHFHVTDGNHLRMIPNNAISLVYSWDSMVHFDKLIVRDYMADIARVMKNGSRAFLHHSNLGEKAPDSDWAKNVGTRSDMSAALMRAYALEVGLDIVSQHIQGRKEGWGEDRLDCITILSKQ